MARSINVPNFVPFWQPLYNESAAKIRRFRWRRDPEKHAKTVNDMSAHAYRAATIK